MKHTMVRERGTALWAETFRALKSSGSAKTLLKCVGGLFFGWMLAGGVLMGSHAPFGLCAVAAAGTGLWGMTTLLGAALGYFFLPQPMPGLQYLAASVLCMAAELVFRGEGPCRRLFGPLCGCASFAVVGAVFLFGQGVSLPAAALYGAECVVIFTATYLYGLLLHPIQEERPSRAVSSGKVTAILTLCATLLLPLTRVTLPLGISPGRVAAGALVLLGACYGGMGTGSATGVLAGATLDAVTGSGYHTLVYGLSGLLAGACSGLPRPAAAGCFFLAHGVLSLTLGGEYLPWSGLAEGAAAALVCLLLPEKTLRRVGRRLRDREEAPGHAETVRETLSGRLRGMGKAFHEAGGQASAAFHQPVRRERRGDVFQRAADRVCRRCPQRSLCWEREAQTTYNVCNDAGEALLRRGRLEQTDLPGFFTARCGQLSKLVSAINEEYAAGRYRQQFGMRLEESRTLLCQQYGEVARLLGDVAEEVREEMDFQPELEERAARLLRFKGVRGQAVVYRGRHRRLYVRLQGKDLTPLTGRMEETRRELSALLGAVLGPPEQQICPGEDRLLLREVERVRLRVEQAGSHRQGQRVSGDYGGAFRGEDGAFYVLLSDGMGSGEEAARQSAMAVRLLERFLRAGVDPQTAIRLLNSSLVLGNRDECTFVTVDLLQADLYTGRAALYKCGAAPSYFRRGDRVQRIPCETLPVGADGPGEPAITRVNLHLREGDLLLLQSDGVEEDEPWVGDLLRRRREPEGLAGDLLAAARKRVGAGADDMTAVAIRVVKNLPEQEQEDAAAARS